MTPSRRTAYSVSTLHRQQGGLRRLGFFIDRIERRVGMRPCHEVSVAVYGWQQGSIALPLASLGYRVTVLEDDDTQATEARAVAGEMGYAIHIVSTEKDIACGGRYDVMIVDGCGLRPALLDAALEYAKQSFYSAEEHEPGIFLASFSRSGSSKNWNELQANLRHAGWRLKDASVGRALIDGLVDPWPLRWASSWLCELEVYDSARPLVMHLMPTLGLGGAERLVYELTARLPVRGFDAKTIAIMDGGPLERFYRDRSLPLEIIYRRDALGLCMFMKLSRRFFIQRPDIVHTHLFGADAWGRLAAFWQRVPMIISTEHNMNPGFGYIKHVVNWLFAKKTTAFIAISETVKEVMIKKDHVPSTKIYLIRNGIDLAAVLPRGTRPFHDVPRLLVTGRLYPQKDHETLLNALAEIKRPWFLKIAGTGPLERELRALTERLHIASRIEWLGVREDIPRLLADADIFCFPYRWEGLGLGVLEAAAAGVPVVTSDLPPIREVLRSSEVTYVPAGDVAAWTRALDATLNDPASAITKASRALPRVHSQISIETMVDGYAKLYREMLT